MTTIIVLIVTSVSTVQVMFAIVVKDVPTVPTSARIAGKNVRLVPKNCAAIADNTAKTAWERKIGVITVIHAGIAQERSVNAEMAVANAALSVKAVKNSVKIVQECFVMSVVTVSVA